MLDSPFGIRVRGGSQHSMWKPRSQESQNNMLSCAENTHVGIDDCHKTVHVFQIKEGLRAQRSILENRIMRRLQLQMRLTLGPS